MRAGGRPVAARERPSLLFYVPDAIAPWPAQPVRWALDFTIGFLGGRAALRDRGRRAARPRPADAPSDRHALERPAEARAAGHRPADAPTGPAHRRALRGPRPAPGARHCGGAPMARGAAAGRSSSRSIRSATPARFCDRFVLLSSGRVCGEGTVAELAALAAEQDRSRAFATSRRCSLRSRSSAFLWPLDKEWRELLVSRAWWVLLLGMGPLVGVSFIGAARTYAEVSN